MKRALIILGWVWCLPLSLAWFVLGIIGGAEPYAIRRAGVVQLVDYKRGVCWAIMQHWGIVAITMGAVTIFRPEYRDDLVTIRHEREHTYQAMWLGVLFPLVYLACSGWALLRGQDSYWGNALEEQACAVQEDISS